MATYKASPGYAVMVGDKTVRFGWRGDYVTNDPAEIAVLDGLVPKWVSKVDEPMPKPEPEVEPEPPKPPARSNRRQAGK